jgi:hypothetical protein
MMTYCNRILSPPAPPGCQKHRFDTPSTHPHQGAQVRSNCKEAPKQPGSKQNVGSPLHPSVDFEGFEGWQQQPVLPLCFGRYRFISFCLLFHASNVTHHIHILITCRNHISLMVQNTLSIQIHTFQGNADKKLSAHPRAYPCTPNYSDCFPASCSTWPMPL